MMPAALDKVNLQRLAKHIEHAVEAFLWVNEEDRIVSHQELRDFIERFLPTLHLPITMLPPVRDHPSLIPMVYDGPYGRYLLAMAITQKARPLDYLTITRGLIDEGI